MPFSFLKGDRVNDGREPTPVGTTNQCADRLVSLLFINP